jgi:hypothetical protein
VVSEAPGGIAAQTLPLGGGEMTPLELGAEVIGADIWRAPH